ncbi:MAG TPA: hypothetical protein VF138_07640 [Caulobacteraceae bacterium]
MTITDEMLMAYVDGELSETDRMKVDSAVAADPALFEKLEQHRRFRARMSGAFASVLAEPVPERLVEAARPSNIISLADRRRGVPTWAAIAATLVLGVMAGLSVPREQPVIGSDMTAHGDLATALDKQLASAQGDSAVRVGLTFKTADTYCRTFSGAEVAGLACRDAGAWKVRMAVPAQSSTSDYRMASSDTPPEVLQAAQNLMVGEPLDAAAEAAAQESGWKAP